MKTEITNDLTENIPKILKSCSNLISEESDFGHMDTELNKAMNERVHKYLEQTVLPNRLFLCKIGLQLLIMSFFKVKRI